MEKSIILLIESGFFQGGEIMSNLDFLLDCTDISEVSSHIDENGNTIISGIFNGSEDLSWTRYEYVFDKGAFLLSNK